ncbi:hypothetical protein L5G28_00255 [Gordonia sp. HY285]|uniref:hypothetical protein n=1 Tax=Gordonia liuliyuniae TaxID=2911517 RepID=UPI001F285BBE|nr:hypothetical protein [Gordonia liuliyuniae]MCF8608601.1 hypothetical protein [Gordonia liuliyuniae]
MAVSKSISTAAAVILAFVVALPFIASPAHAAPRDGTVHARVTAVDDDVIVRISSGSLTVDGGHLLVRDATGRALEKFPLAYIAPDDRTYPIAAQVSGRTATLTPSRDSSASAATPARLLAATEVADKDGYGSKRERDDAALNRFNSEMSATLTLATIIGTVVGVVIGGAAGCLLTMAIGCIPGLTTGAALGGIGGTIVVGGGGAVVSAVRYFTTITAPFKNVTPKKPVSD